MGVGHSASPSWDAPPVPGCVMDTRLMLLALGGSVPGPDLGLYLSWALALSGGCRKRAPGTILSLNRGVREVG